jgi:hypothetical protein
MGIAYTIFVYTCIFSQNKKCVICKNVQAESEEVKSNSPFYKALKAGLK